MFDVGAGDGSLMRAGGLSTSTVGVLYCGTSVGSGVCLMSRELDEQRNSELRAASRVLAVETLHHARSKGSFAGTLTPQRALALVSETVRL